MRDFIEERFAHNLQFVLRERLGKTPAVSPRLKIFALDDSTFSLLGGPTPPFEQWERLFHNLASKNPKAILIDSLFSARPPGSDENLNAAVNRLKEKRYPIHSGAFLVPSRLRFRHELNLNRPQYQLGTYLKGQENSPPIPQRRDYHVYGHIAEYEDAYQGAGHIVFQDVRRLAPFYQITAGQVVPHLAFYAAERISFNDGGLWVDDRLVPLDSKGFVYLNHRPPSLFHKQMKSLRHALMRANNGEPEPGINPGDIILIITEFATGNTDIIEGGPFGAVAGGLFVASLIDGVLQHNFLKPLEWDNRLVAALCIAGFLVGTLAAPLPFWVFSFFFMAGYFVLATYLFSWHGVMLPWALPIAGFAVTGMIQYAYRSIETEMDRLAWQKDFFAEKARRLEEENKKVVLEQSLALGKVVQELLLPKKPSHQFGRFLFDTRYRPAQVMGGDWIYVWEASETERRVIVGDVMGKGPSAAIPVAIVIGTLKDCENQNLSVEETIRRLNQRFVELFGGQITATLACIVLHKDGLVEFYNAGSPGWYLLGPEKTDYLHLRSNPLGLSINFAPAKYASKLPKDTIMFTFTDGYLEGARAVKRLMRQLAKMDASEQRSEKIHELLMSAGEGSRLEDDRTLLAVKVSA